MSRYAVDKLMREVIHNPVVLAAFAADATAVTAGRDLTAAERGALIAHDFAGLYALGAHPFLLTGFVGRLAAPGEAPRQVAAHQASLATLGYPDYST